MISALEVDLDALTAAATRSGARPFKDATGNWSTAVEVALLDTVLSIGAVVDGGHGAGVLPRLRGFKAFRGQANMMRLITTLGPLGLADFVAEKQQMDTLLATSGALLNAGINGAEDVDPDSLVQRAALLDVDGIPPVAWDYFLISLGYGALELSELKNRWLDNFVARATGGLVERVQRDALLQAATEQLNAEHQRRSFGHMPEFTPLQLHQAIFRAEYARETS